MPAGENQVIALKLLHCKAIGPYSTQLRFQPKQRVGHFDISLFLKDESGKISDRPLIEGIYSKGNRSQNMPGWLDIHYSDRADFAGENAVIFSRQDRLAECVFGHIGKAVAPGGMVFVSLVTDIVWEMESLLHKVTRESLSARSFGIPPAATPLGRLLFISGCRNVKSQAYDVQGSSRLAGEKALNIDIERQFAQKLRTQLQEFLGRGNRRESDEFDKLCKICRPNAEDILNRLNKIY